MAEQQEPLKPDQGAADQNPSHEGPPDGLIKQDEIEALLSGGAGAAGKSAGGSESAAGSEHPQAADVADPGKSLRQEDIERLLGSSGEQTPGPKPSPSDTGTTTVPEAVQSEELTAGDIECLLNQAEEALRSIDSAGEGLPSGATVFQFQELAGTPPNAETATLDLISDVELDLKIELGRTNMYLEDVLRLRRGAVVPLDKLAGDPVEIYVNDRLIARGEVLVLNDSFCVRVAELIAAAGVE